MNSLRAVRKKLYLNVVLHVFLLLYLLPNRREKKIEWLGCEKLWFVWWSGLCTDISCRVVQLFIQVWNGLTLGGKKTLSKDFTMARNVKEFAVSVPSGSGGWQKSQLTHTQKSTSDESTTNINQQTPCSLLVDEATTKLLSNGKEAWSHKQKKTIFYTLGISVRCTGGLAKSRVQGGREKPCRQLLSTYHYQRLFLLIVGSELCTIQLIVHFRELILQVPNFTLVLLPLHLHLHQSDRNTSVH